MDESGPFLLVALQLSAVVLGALLLKRALFAAGMAIARKLVARSEGGRKSSSF